MENTSKALLIAAGVLIVILIVTMGIRIVSSTGNVEESTKEVGDTISEKIKDTTSIIAGNYVGHYADVDDDGTVDGIIYEDVMPGRLENYYISKTNYNGVFGTKDVIAPVKGKNNDRFYVMALNDFNSGKIYSWYNAVIEESKPIKNYYNITSKEFGTGRANTQTMMEKWENEAYGTKKDTDIWGNIQNEVNKGWFVPSQKEWDRFDKALDITVQNYKNYGLGAWHWSSSLSGESVACNIGFSKDKMNYGTVNNTYSVRLSTTF